MRARNLAPVVFVFVAFSILAVACGSSPTGTAFSGSSGSGDGGDDSVGSGVGANSSGTNTGVGGASTGSGKTTSTGGTMSSGTAMTTGSGAGGGNGCMPGTADCNGDPNDGCETNTAGDDKNCGMCGTICASGPNSPGFCKGGVCGLACAAGTGDCDKNAANGCETDTTKDPKNCGGCGMDCMGAACVQGACACAAETQKADLVQLDLFIMLDQSGSMSDAVMGGGTKWSAVTTALESFFGDPTSAGIGVGIQYFGLPAGGMQCGTFCNVDADCGPAACGPCFLGICFGVGNVGGDSCTAADYAKAEVEIAPLNPAQATALTNSINAHMPSTDTPTAPALQGAVDHAKAWATAHPTHVVIAIFVTDGDPTECNPQDIPSIANISAAALAGVPSIKTFVIGVGASLGNLNAIAAAGGTGSAFLVDTNANVVMQFEGALKALQKSAVGCQYLIPQPMMGMLDFNKVNVQYTPGNGPTELLPNVANAAACPNTGGWYYDNNANPTQIILCPATCAKVSADPMAKVDVLLGCDTQHM